MSKVRKKRAFLFMLILCMLLFSGCGNRMTPQTAEGVKQVLVDRGIYDENNAYTNSNFEGEAYAVVCNNEWTVCLTKYKTVQSCKDEYAFGKLLLEDPEERKESNYAIVEGIQGEDRYQLIIQVEDTLLVIAGPDTAKEELRELAKEFGCY